MGKALTFFLSKGAIDADKLRTLKTFLMGPRAIVVVNAGFSYDPGINQRCIAIATEAAASNHTVVFIAWEWYKGEQTGPKFKSVGHNMIQVGRFDLPIVIEALQAASAPKTFVLTVPSRDFVEQITHLQSVGTRVVYDIFDDWEEFHKVGQAPWFERSIEDHAFINADKVTSVTAALTDNFSYVREVKVVPNGYAPNRIGPFTSIPMSERGKVVGYFGHLPDGWFDWEGMFALSAADPSLTIELIGDGQSVEMTQRTKAFANIKLLGRLPMSELPSHAARWRCGLIPFQIGRLSRGVDPLKVYEYLAIGLHTFSTGMPHLNDYPNCSDLPSRDDFVAAVRDFASYEKPPEFADPSAFLAKATWPVRIGEVLR